MLFSSCVLQVTNRRLDISTILRGQWPANSDRTPFFTRKSLNHHNLTTALNHWQIFDFSAPVLCVDSLSSDCTHNASFSWIVYVRVFEQVNRVDDASELLFFFFLACDFHVIYPSVPEFIVSQKRFAVFAYAALFFFHVVGIAPRAQAPSHLYWSTFCTAGGCTYWWPMYLHIGELHCYPDWCWTHLLWVAAAGFNGMPSTACISLWTWLLQLTGVLVKCQVTV